MKEVFKEFLVKEAMIPEDLITLMTGEEDLPEDYDFEPVRDHWKKTVKDVTLANFGDSFADAKVEQKFSIYKGSQNQKLNKEFDLGLSRKEAEAMTPEEMQDMLKKTLNERIENASLSTDDQLKQDLQNAIAASTDWKAKFEELDTTVEEKINGIKQEAQNTVFQYQLDQMLERKLSGLDWGIPEIQRGKWKEMLKQDLKESYKINLDEKITSPDGSRAMNFERNGAYDSIDEPIAYLFDKYNLGAVNNAAVTSSSQTVVGGSVTTDKMAPEVKAMLERANAASKNRRY